MEDLVEICSKGHVPNYIQRLNHFLLELSDSLRIDILYRSSAPSYKRLNPRSVPSIYYNINYTSNFVIERYVNIIISSLFFTKSIQFGNCSMSLSFRPFTFLSLFIQADQPSIHFCGSSIRIVGTVEVVEHGPPWHIILPRLQKQVLQLSLLTSSPSKKTV